MERKVIVYIAASLDGYIAKPGDDLSFLGTVQKEGEDYGYGQFVSGVDTVIVGRKTYDWVMNAVPEFPHADKETYVVTRQPREAIGNTRFYSGSLKELVQQLKSVPGKNIFVDGGAALVNAMLQEDLVDELIVSVVPVMVGEGVRLFKEGIPERQWKHLSTRSFDTGLVQSHYALSHQ